MPKINKEQIELLVRLQQIDVESGRIKSTLSTVESRLEALDNKLNEFEQTMVTQEDVIKDIHRKYREYEGDVQTNVSRIEKSQEKLKSVKTNKEYQSGLKEIEDLQAINSKLEDEMLEFLDRIDKSEAEIQQIQEQHSLLVETTCKEKDIISKEAEEGKQKIMQLESDWKEISSAADPELLTIFHRIKANQANGIAIAAVSNAVCLGCNMNIPPQMYNELQRRDSLKYCPHCARIIYWEDNNGRSE